MTRSSSRRSRESGNIIMLFTLLMPFVLMPMAGLAIDACVARLVQCKLQAAIDGAVLGAGRELGTPAVPETLAYEFLQSNFRTDNSAGTWNARLLNHHENYVSGITKRLTMDASATVPLLFLRIFGLADAVVGANGIATRVDSRVILIVDRSFSMTQDDGTGKGHSVAWDAIQEAIGFTQRFIEGQDELGMIAYSSGGVVGYPPTTGVWSPALPTTWPATGGPDSSFQDGTANDMVHQLQAIVADGYTNTSEALALAYIELQKAHKRDLLDPINGGVDTRLNAVVLLTDGVPTAVSISPNAKGNISLKAGTSCLNTTTDPLATMGSGPAIVGTVLGSGQVPPYSTTGKSISGLWNIASLDTTAGRGSNWWMINPVPSPNGTRSTGMPVPIDMTTGLPQASSAYKGCNTVGNNNLMGNGDVSTKASDTYRYTKNNTNLQSTANTQLGKIPDYDMYGDQMNGSAFHASHMTGGPGSSLYTGTELDQSKVTIDYHWGAAIWNAADAAAARIRQDPDRIVRGESTPMPTTIYTIGYTGNNGCDDGLLKRVANDPRASGYVSTDKTGMYVEAANVAALEEAFNVIATAILRLASR